MRDPQRIPYILEAVQALWEKNPDLRLGQLMYNLTQGEYFTEDEELTRRIDTVLAEGWEALSV